MSARKVLIRSKAKFAKPAAYIAEPDLAATEPRPAEPEQRREPWHGEGFVLAVVIGAVVLLALAGAFSFYAHAEVYRPPVVVVAPPILFGQHPVVRDDQWQRQHEHEHDRNWDRERRLGEHHES